MVLGMPWPKRWKPSLDFHAKTVAWRSRRNGRRWQRVATRRPDDFAREVANSGAAVFAMSIKEASEDPEGSAVAVGDPEDLNNLPESLRGYADIFSPQNSAGQNMAQVTSH